MKVCLGGTFNYLHKGHQYLLLKAFKVAGNEGSVFIGLTTGDLLKNKGKIKSFTKRKKEIIKYLSEKKLIKLAIIKAITNKHGPTLEEDFDAIVVSPETKKTAIEINQIREQRGKNPIKIFEIPFVLAKDGKPISSTRIANKEIDEEGIVLNKD